MAIATKDRYILFVAGRYVYFQDWCREARINPRDMSRIRYVSQSTHVRGMDFYNGSVLVILGHEYWKTPVWRDDWFHLNLQILRYYEEREGLLQSGVYSPVEFRQKIPHL